MIKPENLVAANVTIREFKKLELMRESVSRCNFTVYAGLTLDDADQKELLSGEVKTKIAAIIDVDLHKHQLAAVEKLKAMHVDTSEFKVQPLFVPSGDRGRAR